jgi:poly-beta-1,6-N-acetyl-D-glucosamine synthase
MSLNYIEIYSTMRTLITFLAFFILIKYFMYLILAPFYIVQKELRKLKIRIKVKRGQLPDEYTPLVSVIIPAWNEEVGVLTTVKSVLANTYNNIEIIVVNDGSTDGTDAKMLSFIEAFDSKAYGGKKVKYYLKKNGGKGSALNFGIKKANGEIVMTMDADSAHHPNAVANLIAYFRDPGVDAVVGNVKVRNVRNVVGLIQQYEYIFGFYFKRVNSVFNAEYIFGGACAAFRKATTFDVLGYFDTVNKTEDIEYSMRLKLHGLKSVYAEDVITYTEGAADLPGLYNQRLRWKKGRLDTFIKYRRLFWSLDKKHSKFLSWVVLPYAVIGELQMVLEPIFFTAIWTYTLVSGDYLSVGISSLFIMFTYIAAFGFGDRESNILNVLLFPFTWFMFYILTVVEFMALLRSLELMHTNQDVVWQSWARKGIQDDISTKVIAKEGYQR